MANIFTSKSQPKSAIINSSFTKRLSSIFGYQPVEKQLAQNSFEKSTGLRFVKVDLGNDAYRIKQAALGSVFNSAPLATTLEKYFDAYINETTIVYSDIAERQHRLNELRFAVLNDPFLSRCCRLVSDEATQLDDQNRLISIESPSVAFINRCYELFAQWGLTQQRISSACYDLEQYGEGLWIHKVSDRGVEKIIPFKVPQLKERLEFSPIHMAEVIAQINGGVEMNKSRGSKIDKLIDMLLHKEDETWDLNENYADAFDSKLLGFEFDDGIILPPWLVTHFRYQADNSEFFPYGYPPLLMALAPFRQVYSTMALQGLARAASFPVQVYKVKGTEGVGVETAYDTVNMVREEYDNIGATPMSNSIETYTVNTKVWVPEGLLSFEVIESKIDANFTDDIELYQDRVAIAAGVPKAYLDQEFGGFGNSGIALVEQYKPFARHVYTIQSSFLEGLGQLIRLHFAISGEFDYNTPFVLSMRFPAEDMGQEKRDARSASLELTDQIIAMLTNALGMEEGEALPEDIMIDLLSKYTFLDTTDIQRWMRIGSIAKAAAALESEAEGEDSGGGDDGFGGGDFGGGGGGGGDFSFDDMEGGDDVGGDDLDAGGDDAGLDENTYYLKTKKRLREKNRKKLLEKKLKRLKEISARYKECKEEIYFRWLKESNMTEWKSPKGHSLLVPTIKESSPLWESFEVIKKGAISQTSNKKLKELSLSDMVEAYKSENIRLDEQLSKPLGELSGLVSGELDV